MNLLQVQKEILFAQRKFDYVEGHPTSGGSIKVLVALQTIVRFYTLEIQFPDEYPYSMPKVWVRKPMLQYSPHRYEGDQICYMHPSLWNPGRHDLTFVLQRTSKWLSKYEVYRNSTRWPGAGIHH